MQHSDNAASTYPDQSSTGHLSVLALVAMLMVVLIVPAVFGRVRIPEQFDQSVVDQFDLTKASTVFLGNSLLDTRIDADYLSELTGDSAVSLAIDGTAPGIWYVQMKNIVAVSENPPSRVFIFFHDDLITRPIYFTGPEDLGLIERLSQSSISGYGALPSTPQSIRDRILNAFVSIYPIARSSSYAASSSVSSIGAEIAGIEKQELNDSSDQFFSFANKREQDAVIQGPKFHGNFNSAIGKSFLPQIIELTKAIDVDLTVVRVAAKPNPDGSSSDPESLDNYTVDLASYLTTNNVNYIDMSGHIENGTLDAAMYYDGYHLKHRFLATYTEFFAEWMLTAQDGKGTTQ